MSRPLIVMGDKTSHGGTVISADFTCDIDGKNIARVGDMTVCPKCKGTFPITSGPTSWTVVAMAMRVTWIRPLAVQN